MLAEPRRNERRSLLEFDWALPPGVHAAFTTRLGGVSAAPWDSFNLATHVGDEPAHVAANRARLATLLALPAEPAWLNQVHGSRGRESRCRAFATIPFTADAAVATRARPRLRRHGGGLPARAVRQPRWPAHRRRACGLARARRRRARADRRGDGSARRRTHCVVRTCDLAGSTSKWARRCAPRSSTPTPARLIAFVRNARGRWQADLVGLARRRLAALGVTDVSGGQWCTFADRERFYSHRRDGEGRPNGRAHLARLTSRVSIPAL